MEVETEKIDGRSSLGAAVICSIRGANRRTGYMEIHGDTWFGGEGSGDI
jgi:hypothetical protein